MTRVINRSYYNVVLYVLTVILSSVISAAILEAVKYIVLGVNVLIYDILLHLTL